MQNKLEKYLVPLVATLIFIVALFYPAWNSFSETVYGWDILSVGWLGLIILYVPAFFLFPAIYIVFRIARGVEGKMLISRILLFLFWLEGFIGVIVFKYGGPGEIGRSSVRIDSIGPSFWMWTILVWYILFCSFFYVHYTSEKARRFLKVLSALTITLVASLAVNYFFQNLSNYTLQAPLEHAVITNDLIKIEHLVKKGADVNEKTHTPLIVLAAMNGSDPAVVSLLIQKGANVNVRDSWGMSALEAVGLNNINIKKENILEISKILLSSGADQVSKDKTLIIRSSLCEIGIIKLLVNAGANINFYSETVGATPFFQAARYGCLDVVSFLIDNGAKVNVRDSNQRTLFQQGDVYKYPDVVRVLKDAGAVE